MQQLELPTHPFTTDWARAHGLGSHQLTDCVRDRSVRRVLRGVYHRADQPDTPEARAAAAALVLRPHQVVADRSAAWIHGLSLFGYAASEVLPPLETCAYRWRSPCRRDEVDGRTRDLAARDVGNVGPVPVTTPLRTALDLGCNLHRRDAVAALDGLMRLHGITHEILGRELGRFARRRGVVQLRQLIPLADARAESVRESWTRLEILDSGLPPPELQFWIEVGGIPTYRLDLAYPRHRVAVEYDGAEFHDRTPEQRERDQMRRVWLERHGWTVIVVRNGDFTGNNRDRWIAELRDALQPAYSNRRW